MSSPDPLILDSDGCSSFSKLWFSDGSVILKTNCHLYRVHKSILARESSVFNDMFAFPGECSNDEGAVFDGLPVVPMIGDDDQAVRNLLEMIYKPSYSKVGNELLKQSYWVQIYRLSIKYHFSGVEDAFLHELEVAFPQDLNDYIRHESVMARLFMLSENNLFSIIPIVQEGQVTKSFPALFYFCSQHSVKDIFTAALPSEITQILFEGRDKFRNHVVQAFSERIEQYHLGLAGCALSPHCRISSCLALFSGTCQSMNIDVASNDVEFFTVAVPGNVSLCPGCFTAFELIVKDIRAEIWGLLSEMFGLS